ncbi:MAG TPA: hypothetical protein VFH80_28360 [Solirubrobacteraceae bacterium]|nr:hypothetical protein [Solirubrobacteraceae bacterium]
MRERHFPRLCRSCDAPMARQEDSCWNCEAVWDHRSARTSVGRVIPGGHAARPYGGDQPSAPAVSGAARTIAQARPDLDRLADEGCTSAAEGSQRIGAQIALVR